MIRKFFPLDKNYLLEQAQLKSRPALLRQLCQKVVAIWFRHHNPLGLKDDFSNMLLSEPDKGYEFLIPFYDLLSGIYRFRHGDNQLQFLWTGTDHQDQYATEWSDIFCQWTSEFCTDEQFVLAVLDLTYFLPNVDRPDLIGARMEHFLLKYFNLRKNKATGMVSVRALA